MSLDVPLYKLSRKNIKYMARNKFDMYLRTILGMIHDNRKDHVTGIMTAKFNSDC